MLTISKDHVYSDSETGRIYDGVTSVISLEGGSPGLEFVDQWHLEKGKVVHSESARYDLGILDEDKVDPRIKGYLTSYQRYRDKEKTVYAPEHIEVMLCDEVYGYAGTIDRLKNLNDLKTGAYKKADLAQLGGYYGLCQANKIDRDFYMGPDARKIIYLDEFGEFPRVDQYTVREVLAAKDAFLAALLWHRFKNTK